MNSMLATVAVTLIALGAPAVATASEPVSLVIGADGNALAPTPDARPRDPESTSSSGLYASPMQAYWTKRRLGQAVLLIDVRLAEERDFPVVSAPVDLHLPFLSSDRGDSIAAFSLAVGKAVGGMPRGRATPIFLLCDNGRLAAAAADALVSAGYTNAIVVTGGMHGEVEGGGVGWIAAGLPVVSRPAVGGTRTQANVSAGPSGTLSLPPSL